MCQRLIIKCPDCPNQKTIDWVVCDDFKKIQEGACSVGRRAPDPSLCKKRVEPDAFLREMILSECREPTCPTLHDRLHLDEINKGLAELDREIVAANEREQMAEEARARDEFAAQHFVKKPVSPRSQRSALNPRNTEGQ